ncbi:CocE/NonD family hydrolase [Chitinimonas sp.]|uniref:CocE/NonD family hydrolase n=1 Tax=Chitinimonas sp. TaxID=1934313 RepID=UPI002F92D692
MPRLAPLFFRLCCCLCWAAAAAQDYPWPTGAGGDEASLAQAIPKLAESLLAGFHSADPATELDRRFRLQLLTARYAEAEASITALRALRADSPYPSAALHVQYQIMARAGQRMAAGEAFEPAFDRAFRELMGALDDVTAALAIRALELGYGGMEESLRSTLDRLDRQPSLQEGDALALLVQYQQATAYRRMAPRLPALVAEDDARRYLIARDLPVRTPQGATLCALVLRPRKVSQPLPALLDFTIYADPVATLIEARRTASHGYAGVVGLSRGKGCSPNKAVPYEHDGEDAAALINWIATQPWSDGRVGMYGGSYDGFTQWAAAKRMPPALKALMPSVTAAPGIDVPMDGNVFFSFVYYWPFYVTNNATVDEAVMNDRQRWWRMQRQWYVGGTAYRELDRLDGTPNPIFRRWLDHPGYDSYWQAMIPFREEFARIDIPVLTTTGYYDDGQLGALYYYQQHRQYRPDAEHYLLIGPYDHIRGQRGTIGALGEDRTQLRGYRTDPAARIELGELRYQWFDYVLRGGPRPAILADKVNYQLMGANVWKHVPSIAAMGEPVRYYLGVDRPQQDRYPLTRQVQRRNGVVSQTVALADRSDIDRVFVGGGIVNTELDTWGTKVWISEPLAQPTELSGLFSAHLELEINKRDLDLSLMLYELTAQGEYVQLSYLQNRLSYARDRTRRQLLQPGRRLSFDLQAGRLTSRLLAKGSRLLMMLGPIRQPQLQINYGSGKDVSDETLADGRQPLRLRWYGGSYLTLPLRPAG